MNGIHGKQKSESAPDASPLIGIVKRCTKCEIIKSINDFYEKPRRKKRGHGSWCKECLRKQARINRINNNIKYIDRDRQYRETNKESVRRSYRKAKNKFRSTINGRLHGRISTAIRESIIKKAKQGRKWENLVGYTANDLRIHLEKLFLPGMTWDNYRKWQIDHIIPVSAFNFKTPDDMDFKKCWALRNLRPLWAVENIKKGNKLSKPFQPSLLLKIAQPTCR